MIESLYRILPDKIKEEFIYIDIKKITEIRIRNSKPIVIRMGKKEYISKNKAGPEDFLYIMERASNKSVYSIQNDINEGFVTIGDGNRIGVVGEAVIQNGTIKNIKNISSMNIRISHEVKECSLNIFNKIYNNELKNTLIISSPGAGKTTILRDIIRKISNAGLNVALIDERGEVASICNGVYTLDVGIRTDVISYIPKDKGINMVIRSMGPDVIATDEIGTKEDVDAIKYAIRSGVKVLVTMHANCIKDLRQNVEVYSLIKNKYFEYVVILTNTAGEFKQDIYTNEEVLKYD